MKKRILIALVALGSLICPALAQEAAVKTKMMGSFIGFHALGGSHNIGGMDLDFKFLGTDFSKLRDYRYEGWFIGAGVAYGYAWALSKHWNLEAELGVGYIYSKADKFNCAQCGDKLEDDKAHNYVGPTKAALNLDLPWFLSLCASDRYGKDWSDQQYLDRQDHYTLVFYVPAPSSTYSMDARIKVNNWVLNLQNADLGK